MSAATRSFTMHYLKVGTAYNLSVQALYSGGHGQKTTVPVFMG